MSTSTDKPTMIFHNVNPTEDLKFMPKAKKAPNVDGLLKVAVKGPFMQSGVDQNDLRGSLWGINPEFEEFQRNNFEFTSTPEDEAKIAEIDELTMKTFNDKSRAWTGKDNQASKYTYVSLLKPTDDGEVVKMKVIADPESKNATVVKVLTEDDKIVDGTLKSVTRGCQVLVIAEIPKLWIDTFKLQYGLTLIAKMILVKPADPDAGVEARVLPSFILAPGLTWE